MAPVSGLRQVNGHTASLNSNEAPPSTLAAHLAPTNENGDIHFDQTRFNQLLDEALGSDENGQPNLGNDVDVNQTLIRIIFQAGIDPILQRKVDNPFRSGLSGRALSQVARCLEVVRIAIERCPRVLLATPTEETLRCDPAFHNLLQWLTPRALILLGSSSDPSNAVVSNSSDIVAATISAGLQCQAAGLECHDVKNTLYAYVEVTLSLLEACDDLSSTTALVSLSDPETELSRRFSALGMNGLQVSQGLDIGTPYQAFLVVAKILAVVSNSLVRWSSHETADRAKSFSVLLGHFRSTWTLALSYGEELLSNKADSAGFLVTCFEILRGLCDASRGSLRSVLRKQLWGTWTTVLSDTLTLALESPTQMDLSVVILALNATNSSLIHFPELGDSLSEMICPLLSQMHRTVPAFATDLQEAAQRLSDRLHGDEPPLAADFETSKTLLEDGRPHEGRARKRPRLSSENQVESIWSWQQNVSRGLTQLLSGRAVNDLEGLSKTSPPFFRAISVEDQIVALNQLGRTACRLSDSIPTPATGPTHSQGDCSTCDFDLLCKDGIEMTLESSNSRELIDTILAIASLTQKTTKTRIAALLALRRLLYHVNSPETFDLQHSPAGEWVMQAIRSSARDVRMAAVQTLRPFIVERRTISSSTIHANRVYALEYLQSLWARNEATVQETVVLALTMMARIVGDQELNIILIRLIEYLGHGNAYINGLVYAEIQKLSEALKLPVAKLVSPFWRTVGVVVIKNFSARPVVAQQLCDLLGWPMDGLLVRIEDHAIPYLVLSKKKEVIERIATAHEPPVSTFHLCMQRTTFTNILAYLLTQSFADPEETIMALLLHVSQDFAEHDLATWIGLESTPVACELLKAIADAGQGRSSKPHQALHLLTQLLSRKSSHPSGSKRSDNVGAFLESSCLAMTNQFIFTLSFDETREPILEKRRALAAVGELVRLGKSKIIDALPQICACLRSAIESKSLCDVAFGAWASMIGALREEDVEPLVDQTMAIIVRSWDSLSSESQKVAQRVVSDFLKNHPGIIQEAFSTMPSLSSIPSMAEFEAEIMKLKLQTDDRQQFAAFVQRLENENLVVVEQALQELTSFLELKHEFIHRSILREQPDSIIKELTRALLNCCVQFKATINIAQLCGQCLGCIGCLDPNQIDSTREKKTMVVLDNFSKAEETVSFVVFFLENVLVKAFLSASSTRSQGFLAWAMQELLKLCSLDDAVALRSRTSGPNSTYRRWLDLPENVRNTLTPFLTSRYLVQEIQPPGKCSYPVFKASSISHIQWLRVITLDFLHRSPGLNSQMIFSICERIIAGQDAAIPNFLLPYATLNLVISGIEEDKKQIIEEMLTILQQPIEGDARTQEDIRFCSETIFDILDYMSNWLQQKRKSSVAALARSEKGLIDPSHTIDQAQIKSVESVLAAIPADVMSKRAIDCKSYARALFNWENHIRQSAAKGQSEDELLERLQEIYAQIDEPDGIEGISSRLQVLDIEQQVLEHEKAGRWTAAQSWYEMQLVKDPSDSEVQLNLMRCLKESGQYDVLLHHFDGLDTRSSIVQVLPYALEAAWVSNRWDTLSRYLTRLPTNMGNFNVSLATVLQAMHQQDVVRADMLLRELEGDVATGLTVNNTSSLQACHDTMLRLHVLRDVRDALHANPETKIEALSSFNARLNILGSYIADKQYVLGARRAAMNLSPTFNKYDVASTWLASARLARKSVSSNYAFNLILHASDLGEKAATIEQAKLMWQGSHHRKAIQTLEGAIESGAFVSHSFIVEDGPVTLTTEQQKHQNEVMAKAYILLGKWLDSAGQTNSDVIIKTFRKATDHHRRWEKGHYYLGKYYNKILDSEKTKEPSKQSQAYLSGEAAKLVIDNYLRAASCGSKYVFQTLPKMLTLWLDLVSGSEPSQDARRGNEKFQAHNAAQRKVVLTNTQKQVKKYAEKLSPIALYTILPQVVARICHTNNTVHEILETMILRVVSAFPQQALWTLLAVTKSYSKDRQTRGLSIIRKISDEASKSGKKGMGTEFRSMVHAGQKFFDELLRVSEFPIEGKTPRVSLARDLGFNHKIAPSRLVVPVESCLIPSLPPSFDAAATKNFRAFPKDPVTICAFLDDALVLASLQKPRKLSIRGSDGNIYGVLAKPKDDLRKDQRLMEFNTMINRFLKRDVEASKRRLYIRTYAVIPLNEECGLIEWVDNLKTFRDILLKLYKERNISPNYVEIRNLLDEACSGPPEKVNIFPNRILKSFPPIFYEWFIESFPDPTAWFNARLRYTRSAAVMSIVGHVLGLGDRHGENILFEEDNGGTLHVDFNCLFDKGLTFEKPECVPFRLTHNMVDAFGAYGYNGPFRRCCEITLTLLRNNEDALMTILETFLHDPTTDFVNTGKKKKTPVPGVPDSPMGILDGVRGKVRGMLMGESVPLSVGGYVEEMVKRSVDPTNLCRMYIGWCAFF